MLFIKEAGKLFRTKDLRIDNKVRQMENPPNTPDRETRILALQKHYNKPENKKLWKAS